MHTLNHVMFLGTVTDDPEIIQDRQHVSFIHFQLATQFSYLTQEGLRVFRTQLHTIWLPSVSNETIAARLQKGLYIYIQGELRTGRWNDPTGKMQDSIIVWAHDCQILYSSEEEDLDIFCA